MKHNPSPVINFKVLALSSSTSILSTCLLHLCAGFGEKKSQYPNKGQNLKTGSFFLAGGAGGLLPTPFT